MTNNDDSFRWDCIKGTRDIKDKISAELNAMTPEKRHLFFIQMSNETRRREKEREKINKKHKISEKR
jgi:hypothetical protein